jgi:hypothetical protein
MRMAKPPEATQPTEWHRTAAFGASRVFACFAGEGLLAEPIAVLQLQWRELVFMPPFGHWSANPSAERAFDRVCDPLRGRYVALSSAASSVENENDIRGQIFGYRSALVKLMYRRTGLSCGYRRRLYPAACPILRTPTERGRKSWCGLAGRHRPLTSVYFEDCRHIFFGMASNSIG